MMLALGMALHIQEQALRDQDEETHAEDTTAYLAVAIGRDHSFLKLVRTLLDELRLEVYKDELSDAIVETIGRLQPAVVIMDVDFGHEAPIWELLRALKEDPATQSIPVIACAAAPWLLEEERSMLERNAVRTWTEPYDLLELLRMIDQVVTERSLPGWQDRAANYSSRLQTQPAH